MVQWWQAYSEVSVLQVHVVYMLRGVHMMWGLLGCILGEVGVYGKVCLLSGMYQNKASLLCAGTEVHVSAEICILIHHEVNIHCVYMCVLDERGVQAAGAALEQSLALAGQRGPLCWFL